MTSALARYSAILSALLALLGTAVWFVHGAPDLPKLTPVWHTTATDFLVDLWQLAPWASRLALILISPSVLLGGSLCLFLLLRGSNRTYIRELGVGLGWWVLVVFYMAILPAIPGAVSWPIPLPILVAGDVGMMFMSLACTHAFMRFWANFPRPISAEDVTAFLVKSLRRDIASMSSWRQRWNKLLSPKRDLNWVEYRARKFATVNHAILACYLSPGRLAIAAAITIAAIAGALWRADAYMPNSDVGHALSMLPFTVLTFIFIMPWANLANIFRMRRATGDAEERRKIEWVRVSFWIAIVLFFAFAALSNAPLLYQGIFGGDALSPGVAFSMMDLQFLAPLLAPLLILFALIVSIFYRGDVDPKLALRGVTLWTVLGVLLTLIFALVERSVAVKLSAVLGLAPQTGYVTAGAVVAATFQPVRKIAERQVNRFVERVLPGSESQAEQKKSARQPRKNSARLRRRSAS